MTTSPRQRPCLPISELKDGQWYAGHCRNSQEARWSAKKQRFEYIRVKFDMKFLEEIHHPDNEKHYDVFYPAQAISESEVKRPINAPPVQNLTHSLSN